ncbi:hypothetical protein Afil01_19810 [Actinorhabdospora filicis]|uniref:Uncharacterized protein n=1 Tax=Actinorhabdospora filicis TaxID=1785913 RepID=A0A9W6SHE0_9ACTN|nr:hypothetical protein [Actinorhabdospora filicis]GLZ77174.1 hypothetical protein Afil01_19810 [Actinorhabdospora filicis]
MEDSTRALPPSSTAADGLSPDLLGEVADLLRDIAYDRVRPDIRPSGTAVDPGWLRAAVEEQYGLLGAALNERIEPR